MGDGAPVRIDHDLDRVDQPHVQAFGLFGIELQPVARQLWVFALQLGSQFRLYATDWLALELTFSDYIFETTILARSKTTHNLSLALGLAVYF